jgi:tryptophan-rich sensory protein
MDHSMKQTSGIAALAVFVIAVVGIGFTLGYLNRPDAWYAALNKPWFNPPNWIFAPVWSVIYLLIAIAGWRTWNFDRRGPAMQLWFVQMGLNFLWPPTFFSAQRPGVALGIILLLFAAILAFIVRQWKGDRVSSALFVPYAAWIGFASMLNLAIVRLN